MNKSLLMTWNLVQTDFTGLLLAFPGPDEACASVVVVAYVTGLYRLTVKCSAEEIEIENHLNCLDPSQSDWQITWRASWGCFLAQTLLNWHYAWYSQIHEY